MLCLKKRRTYSFTQGACTEAPRHQRRSASSTRYNDAAVAAAVATATLPRKIIPREERSSAMVLTVTEDIPADMLAGSMELLVQIPRDQYMQTQRVTVQRSTPMMDLLVQIATAHKLAASSYTLQAIGERGLVLPHQPNTPIGALDALQVKLLPKQGTFIPRKNRLPNQPFETTFRLQVHLPRNQLYVSRVSPKTNLGEILDEVCREKNLDRNKYELRHPGNISEALDLNLTLEDYQIQEVNLYPRSPSRALSSQDIMAFQRQEECRRQQSRHQGVFGFMFKKSKESSVSTDSLGNRSVSPARSDETARSSSPIQHSQPRSLLQQQSSQHKQFAAPAVPSRPLRKRRPAPKPPTQQQQTQQRQETMSVVTKGRNENGATHASDKDKIVISHSRNSSDSSGYHEASVLSDHPDTIDRMPETLPRRGRMQGILESPRKLAHTSQASKSLGNLAMASSHGGTLSRGISNTSLSSTGQRKKRAAPPPPMARPLPSAISVQGLERIVDSDESLTSDMDLSKPSSDIEAAATSSSQASSDIACNVRPVLSSEPKYERIQNRPQPPVTASSATTVEPARVVKKELAPPVPKPRKTLGTCSTVEPASAATTAAAAASPPQPEPASRANTTSPENISSAHGLPSLTEDEREEIALAIDAIVVAATGHSADYEDESSLGEDVEKRETLDQKVEAEKFENPVVQAERNDEVKDDDNIGTQEELSKPLPPEVPAEDAVIAKVDHSDEPSNVPEESAKPQLELEESEASEAVIFAKCKPKKKPIELEETSSERESHVELEVVNSAPVILEALVKAKPSDAAQSSLLSERDVETSTPSVDRNAVIDEPVIEKPKMNGQVKFEVVEDEKDVGPSCAIISAIPKSDKSLSVSVGEVDGKRIEMAMSLGSGKSAPTDTDILLQKVSDTLSQSFVPPSPPPTPEDEEEVVSLAGPPAGFGNEQLKKKKPEHATVVDAKPTVALGHEKSTAKRQKSRTSGTTTTTAIISSSTGTSINATAAQLEPEEEEAEEEEDRGAPSSNGSAQNLTAVSQQDTSDYVSASGEDLSIGDWEYQIPAPPSAFRDDSDAEQPQLPAQQPAKESISIQAEVHPKPAEPRKPSLDAVDFCRPQPRVPKPVTPQQQQPPSDATQQRKAEVISELETKINGSSSVVGHKPAPEVARDDSYAPKIAPVENSLSNFTITTYSRQKSLDIFEPAQLEPAQQKMDPSESRVQAFATLTRGRNGVASEYAEERLLKATGMKNAISMERVSVPLVDERAKFVERNEISRDKAVHRSKSYIVLSTNEKFQNRANEVETSRNEKRLEERSSFESSEPSKKFTSLANVNGSSSSSDEVPRNKEKFSQWRENILRKQEEPSKEKQLQSLQVLKSILPKLKNAQATERSNYSNIGDTFTAKERQEPQREQLRAASPPPSAAPVTTTAPSEVKLRPTTQRRNHEPTKRYTYGGPPAVSLGSWSERPSLNVQIKNDSDYKLGGSGSALSGARTVVNLNAETNEKKEPPTTPVKNTPKEPAKEESCVDTSSVNFRELTKAFGQAEVRLRPKPPVTVRSAVQPQRHSEYLERDGHAPKINGFADSHKVAATTPTTKTNTGFGQNRTNGPATPAKRYTSVVGITSSSSGNGGDANEQPNFRFANGGVKQQPAVQPVLKSVNGIEKNAVPKPPTMPIITGVTLKSVSARPKSSPVSIQQDPRDQLLESIRNFGGRDRLKKAAERR